MALAVAQLALDGPLFAASMGSAFVVIYFGPRYVDRADNWVSVLLNTSGPVASVSPNRTKGSVGGHPELGDTRNNNSNDTNITHIVVKETPEDTGTGTKQSLDIDEPVDKTVDQKPPVTKGQSQKPSDPAPHTPKSTPTFTSLSNPVAKGQSQKPSDPAPPTPKSTPTFASLSNPVAKGQSQKPSDPAPPTPKSTPVSTSLSTPPNKPASKEKPIAQVLYQRQNATIYPWIDHAYKQAHKQAYYFLDRCRSKFDSIRTLTPALIGFIIPAYPIYGFRTASELGYGNYVWNTILTLSPFLLMVVLVIGFVWVYSSRLVFLDYIFLLLICLGLGSGPTHLVTLVNSSQSFLGPVIDFLKRIDGKTTIYGIPCFRAPLFLIVLPSSYYILLRRVPTSGSRLHRAWFVPFVAISLAGSLNALAWQNLVLLTIFTSVAATSFVMKRETPWEIFNSWMGWALVTSYILPVERFVRYVPAAHPRPAISAVLNITGLCLILGIVYFYFLVYNPSRGPRPIPDSAAESGSSWLIRLGIINGFNNALQWTSSTVVGTYDHSFLPSIWQGFVITYNTIVYIFSIIVAYVRWPVDTCEGIALGISAWWDNLDDSDRKASKALPFLLAAIAWWYGLCHSCTDDGNAPDNANDAPSDPSSGPGPTAGEYSNGSTSPPTNVVDHPTNQGAGRPPPDHRNRAPIGNPPSTRTPMSESDRPGPSGGRSNPSVTQGEPPFVPSPHQYRQSEFEEQTQKSIEGYLQPYPEANLTPQHLKELTDAVADFVLDHPIPLDDAVYHVLSSRYPGKFLPKVNHDSLKTPGKKTPLAGSATNTHPVPESKTTFETAKDPRGEENPSTKDPLPAPETSPPYILSPGLRQAMEHESKAAREGIKAKISDEERNNPGLREVFEEFHAQFDNWLDGDDRDGAAVPFGILPDDPTIPGWRERERTRFSTVMQYAEAAFKKWKVKLASEEKERRFESERHDKERLEKERLKKERRKKEKLDKERLEKERQEKERREKERLENERLEKERLEKERLEKEKLKEESLKEERLEKRKLERENLEKERLENERLQNEELQNERLEKERLQNERLQNERLEKERLENERLQNEWLQNERLENERLQNERLQNERLQNERLQNERLQNERLQNERLENERLQNERLQNERLQNERLENERLENERLENERLVNERLENKKLRNERLRKGRLQKDRLQSEKLRKGRLLSDKRQKKQLEKLRLEQATNTDPPSGFLTTPAPIPGLSFVPDKAWLDNITRMTLSPMTYSKATDTSGEAVAAGQDGPDPWDNDDDKKERNKGKTPDTNPPQGNEDKQPDYPLNSDDFPPYVAKPTTKTKVNSAQETRNRLLGGGSKLTEMRRAREEAQKKKSSGASEASTQHDDNTKDGSDVPIFGSEWKGAWSIPSGAKGSTFNNVPQTTIEKNTKLPAGRIIKEPRRTLGRTTSKSVRPKEVFEQELEDHLIAPELEKSQKNADLDHDMEESDDEYETRIEAERLIARADRAAEKARAESQRFQALFLDEDDSHAYDEARRQAKKKTGNQAHTDKEADEMQGIQGGGLGAYGIGGETRPLSEGRELNDSELSSLKYDSDKAEPHGDRTTTDKPSSKGDAATYNSQQESGGVSGAAPSAKPTTWSEIEDIELILEDLYNPT